MDNDSRRGLRRKKLCFSYQEPWVLSHGCLEKENPHYIELSSDNREDEDDWE